MRGVGCFYAPLSGLRLSVGTARPGVQNHKDGSRGGLLDSWISQSVTHVQRRSHVAKKSPRLDEREYAGNSIHPVLAQKVTAGEHSLVPNRDGSPCVLTSSVLMS